MSHSLRISDDTRQYLAEFLPDTLRGVLNSYRNFVDAQQENNTPKGFRDFHTAGKAAANHIHLLLKLATLADLPGDNSDLAALMKEAINEIGAAEGEGDV